MTLLCSLSKHHIIPRGRNKKNQYPITIEGTDEQKRTIFQQHSLFPSKLYHLFINIKVLYKVSFVSHFPIRRYCASLLNSFNQERALFFFPFSCPFEISTYQRYTVEHIFTPHNSITIYGGMKQFFGRKERERICS